MPLHPLAGKPPPRDLLENIPRLVSAYYRLVPDPEDPAQQVRFGTSGHRGSANACSFNEGHVTAIAQAVAEHRGRAGIDGPLFLGMDTHALSEPALVSAVEVFVANGIEVFIDEDLGYTPTPVISRAILGHNAGRTGGLADGVVITPSHNPPSDGGFKYNPPSGGPAGSDITGWIEARSNELLRSPGKIRRTAWSRAIRSEHVHRHDYRTPFVEGLGSVIDMAAIRASGLRIGADPMGGSGIDYWDPIAERYGLALECVSDTVDPAFRFMRVDKDGKIRMDCSSPSAMAGLVDLKDRYDIAFGNDTDFDRHGIVTPTGGLMNPNHYLAVAIDWLFRHRPDWRPETAIGKTLVSSAMIDRVASDLGRDLVEVPVGFKWFVDGLADGSLGFGGEESAGAAFLCKDGRPWTTDKDGFSLALLAAEITAVSGEDPSVHYGRLTERHGRPAYERLDSPATTAQKRKLAALSPDQVRAQTLAGDPITARLTRAPGNDAPIGGLKVTTARGWFAARPSGTEDIYKIYAESFDGPGHLARIQEEARSIVDAALAD